MSRIGRLPIPVPSGVDVQIDGRAVTVKGPKGTLTHTVAEPIEINDNTDKRAEGLRKPRRESGSHAMTDR